MIGILNNGLPVVQRDAGTVVLSFPIPCRLVNIENLVGNNESMQVEQISSGDFILGGQGAQDIHSPGVPLNVTVIFQGFSADGQSFP